jgi:hypothetical protein
MSGLFKTPKMPKIDKPQVPLRSDAEVAAAAEDERKRQSATRASSWLTGGLGVPRGGFSSAGAQLLSGQQAA